MLFDKDGFYNPILDFKPEAVEVIDTNTTLYDAKESLRLGNTFPSLYKPYKNYNPVKLKGSNERENCLLEIQMLDFVITDLNLYLDIHPNDEYVYRLFKQYVNDCKKKKEVYVKRFGPLSIDDLSVGNDWSKGVWPWEEGRI